MAFFGVACCLSHLNRPGAQADEQPQLADSQSDAGAIVEEVIRSSGDNRPHELHRHPDQVGFQFFSAIYL